MRPRVHCSTHAPETSCIRRTAPRPGPENRKLNGLRIAVPEEERRAEDMVAMRHACLVQLAALCVVDDDEQRADAETMLFQSSALLKKHARQADEEEGEGEEVEGRMTLVVHISAQAGAGERVMLQVTARTTMAQLKQQVQAASGAARRGARSRPKPSQG